MQFEIETSQIDAAWFSTAIEEVHVGKSAVPLSVALRLPYIPVTRVENMCASGTEAFRGAVYAVASGAADIALAVGVEKLKDTGYGGLPQRGRGPLNDMVNPNASAPGNFAQLATAYRQKHGVQASDLKRGIAQVSVKSHENGAKNPKAHLQKAVTMDTVLNAPMIAEPLGLFDCCGVSDGSAAAIVTYTTSGSTTLRAARERPDVPIIGLTPNQGTARRLAAVWGVHSIFTSDASLNRAGGWV